MMKSFGTPASYKIIEQLEQHGHEAVFVGGAVRDYLLGKRATDIDIATSAEPTEVKEVFVNTIDIGIAHGTVLVILDDEPIEVTTYRTEGTYSDARRPDEVKFVKSLREDLLRRDFTINALAMTKAGALIDLFGGCNDIQNKVIRAVGIPDERFQEDALRMMRAIRFASVLGFTIDTSTFDAIQKNSSRLQQVSIERIKIEMDKLFLGVNPFAAFQLFEKSGLRQYLPLFPELMEGIERVLPFNSAKEGWAYLAISGGFITSAFASAYKLSNDEKKFIASVEKAYTIRAERSFSIEEFYLFDVDVLQAAEKFYRSMNDSMMLESVPQFEAEKHKLPILSAHDLQVNGKDLLDWAGIRGGKWTGEWMKKIEYAVLHGQCENNPNKIKEWFLNDFNSEK